LISKEETNRLDSEKCLIIICAYNEEKNLPFLLDSLSGKDVLVIDDGSVDTTKVIANIHGASVLAHEKRLGKAVALADGISYAFQNSYGTIVEIDADATPEPGAFEKVLNRLSNNKIGAVSCRQIPIGQSGLAYHIDELIWAMLTEGKRIQMKSIGSCHLGAVLVAFKTELVDSVEGSINDDEQVGISIKKKGFNISFDEDAIVYFDASSCLGHILERRRRMYYGHLKFAESSAPSMQTSISLLALTRAIVEDPRRIVWAIPTIVLDGVARILAWKDVRSPQSSRKYSRWVTTYAKDDTLVIRASNSD